MKTNLIFALLVASLFTTAGFAQQTTIAYTAAGTTPRITFMLKNTLGYHRMFRVEGPGVAYGFTMNRHETVPCNWPVGSSLYFSQDGETKGSLILTVSANDEGKILTTDSPNGTPALSRVSGKEGVTVRLRNPGLLPRKVTLISYVPGETGNGTNGFMLSPRGTRAFTFPVGTKLYLADSEQVDVVMSGKRIDSSKPFLTITQEDAGRLVDVR